MSFHRIFAIFLRQMFLLRRSLGRVFGIFYWSSVELFLWGVLTVYLNRVSSAGFNFVTVMLGALILWDFLLRAEQGVATSFLEDIWSRNLANIFGSPVTVGELLTGFVLASFVLTLASGLFMAFLAWALFAFNLFQFGFLLIPYILVLLALGWTLGIFITAILLRYGPAAEVLAWSLPFLFQPLAAVFYPVSALPKFLQVVAKVFPATYIFEGMRSVILWGYFESKQLLLAILLTFCYLALGVLAFVMAHRAARKHGYLVHFSTEGW